MKKDINYHIWNDLPIEADYYTNIELPNGGVIYTSIGKIFIEKGDAVYLDYGRSLIQYTMSGKGPQAEFPYGKIQLHGNPASVVLNQSKNIQFVKSSKEVFDDLIKKQTERVNKNIPELKNNYIKKYMEKLEESKKLLQQAEVNKQKTLAKALAEMESFFKPKS